MRYDSDEHARSCKAMLLTITLLGICKKVTEVIFLQYCHFVSRTAPIYSQRPRTAQFVAIVPPNCSQRPQGGVGAHFENQRTIPLKLWFSR